MASQQIQFYQYRPDSDARHQAVFTPMPTEQPTYSPMAGYPHPHAQYPAPQYWHPAHYHPQGHHFMPQRLMSQHASPLTLTMPMPKGQMEHLMDHRHSSPPTPSLSACPSTASSPPASSVNVTPVHSAGYFHLPLESSKEEPMLTLPLMEEWTESAGKHMCEKV